VVSIYPPSVSVKAHLLIPKIQGQNPKRDVTAMWYCDENRALLRNYDVLAFSLREGEISSLLNLSFSVFLVISWFWKIKGELGTLDSYTAKITILSVLFSEIFKRIGQC